MIKKIVSILINTIVGWIAGLLITLVLAFIWLNVIPVVDRTGQGPGLLNVVVALLEMVSPFAIIGALIGGLVPKEGSRGTQMTYAAIISAFVSAPVALFLFWYTGF